MELGILSADFVNHLENPLVAEIGHHDQTIPPAHGHYGR
jgi:hypothetical protein